MLLVKWKESKNLNKNTLLLKAYSSCALFLCVLFTPQLHASQTDSLSNPSSIASIFLSLLLVVAIIFALAFVARRFNVTQAGNGQLKVVASLAAGSKERVLVIEVGEEQFLVGVTAHNINHLAKLDKPIKGKVDSRNSDNGNNNSFQAKLVQAMANGITGKKGQSND